MNESPFLLLDCHQLIWSAVHAIGSKLQYQGDPTFVHFGFLHSVIKLQEEHNTKNICFCFDYGFPVRREVYPDYKKKRKSRVLTEEEQEVYGMVQVQINQLRKQYLKDIGFKNVFWQKGYEADDIIGMICKRYRKEKKLIIVSTDQDMYQLLHKNVSIWRTTQKSFFTKQHFKDKFGIRPKQWATVKALAGCSTDEVCGIMGVGEATAVKYLRGELNPDHKKYQSIKSSLGVNIKRRNLPLIRIPYPGTKKFKLRKDKGLDWSPVLKKLGIKTLAPESDFIYRER